MSTIQTHERGLAQQLYLGLRDLEGVDIYGPPLKEEQRAPTISFTIENKRPEDVCKFWQNILFAPGMDTSTQNALSKSWIL